MNPRGLAVLLAWWAGWIVCLAWIYLHPGAWIPIASALVSSTLAVVALATSDFYRRRR